MFKNFIKRIAEAVMAIILPIITAAKEEIVGKMDAQNRETSGIKELVVKLIAMIGENEKNIQELKANMNENARQLALVKSQLEAIQNQQTTTAKTNQQEFSEVKDQVASIIDNIPQELKEERLKQEEERVQKELAIQKTPSDEKPNYEQIANNIHWQCQCNQEEDLVINDDLPCEVIQKLLIFSDITVRFEAGHIVVSQKTAEDPEPFDAAAISKAFEEKKSLARKLKYDQLLQEQLTFVKQKVKEQICEYTQNPYQYKKVVLSECVEVTVDAFHHQKVVVTEAMKANPMYAEFANGYSFFVLDEVLDFLKKQGFVLELVPNNNSNETCSLTTISGYSSLWFFTNKNIVGMKKTGELFEDRIMVNCFKGFAEVRLHILSPGEKQMIR